MTEGTRAMRTQTGHHDAASGLPAVRRAARPRRGFTIVEILVVIVIILVIVGLTFVSINAAVGGGRLQAERTTVQGLALAVEQFTQQFGFPPPLVQDGIQGVGGAMTVPR